MENFGGFIGCITAAVLKAGLNPDTENAYIVRPLLKYDDTYNTPSSAADFEKASEDIGNIAAAVFRVSCLSAIRKSKRETDDE